jgi:hypothetical protein
MKLPKFNMPNWIPFGITILATIVSVILQYVFNINL